MRTRRRRMTISNIGIGDLAVSYASQTVVFCQLTHSDGYVEYLCSIKVHSLKRTGDDRTHIVFIEFYGDLNRPGEDAGSDHHWQKAKIRFDQFKRTGKWYGTWK